VISDINAAYTSDFSILELMVEDLQYPDQLKTEQLPLEDSCLLIPDRLDLGLQLKMENLPD
jgi:hypothetical protein